MRKWKYCASTLLGLLSLQSCALSPGPDLHGLKLSSVKVVSASDVVGFLLLAKKAPPDKRFLDVHLSAERDLIKYAKQYEYNILNETSLCREGQLDPSKQLQNDSYVYDRLGVVEAVRKADDGGQDQAGYDLYIAVQSVPLASGQVFEYNLQRDPQDVCVRLRGGNMLGDSFTSNTIVIPKAVIAEAMRG